MNLQSVLNRVNINTLADILTSLKFGNVLRSLPAAIRKAAGVVGTGVPATAHVVDKQSTTSPAASIVSAYARVGGVTGPLDVVATIPPATGEISISSNGRIILLAADAITDLDIHYLPEIGEVVELQGNVVSDEFALPSWLLARGAIRLVEAEALTGTLTGVFLVEPPATAVATGEAALDAAKALVAFAAADAVTSARVKVLVAYAEQVNEALDAESTFI